MTGNKISSLYIHVPFCASICYYCDFARRKYSRETASAWLDALAEELQAAVLPMDLETIYIGGGTPSSLDHDLFERLLDLIDPYCSKVREYTVECNPETVDFSKIQSLKQHGVNRISMGLQSAEPALLRRMNRQHSAADVKRLAAQFSACGISNISLDLMYGLPGQDTKQLLDSVQFACSLNPSHLSLYSLTVEPNSVFGKQGVQQIDPDLEADMYELICTELKQHGYEHYEISNFARDGRVSLHNVRVWEYNDFYGIGYGASGKDPQGRYDHADSLSAYLKDPLFRRYTPLSENEQLFETVMMGLRLRDGISDAVIQERFCRSLRDVYPDTIRELEAEGMLEFSHSRIRCTDRGWPILNSLLVRFMEEADL